MKETYRRMSMYVARAPNAGWTKPLRGRISRLGRDTNKHVGKNKIVLYVCFISTNFVDGCRMPVRNEPHQ